MMMKTNLSIDTIVNNISRLLEIAIGRYQDENRGERVVVI